MVSILHRVSGLLMILSIPVATALFAAALSGSQGFAAAAGFIANPLVKLALLVLGWAFLHHLFAGIRYLIIDTGRGVDRAAARKSAWTALSAALAVAVVGGGVLL